MDMTSSAGASKARARTVQTTASVGHMSTARPLEGPVDLRARRGREDVDAGAGRTCRRRGPRSSAYRRAWIALGLIALATLVFLHLSGSRQHLFTATLFDLLKHVFAFGAVMVWFGGLHRRGIERGLICSCLILAGVVLEFLQGELWRYDAVEYADMGADAAGCFLGWLLLKLPLGEMIKTRAARAQG
jgi:hypothetical protein